MRYPAWNSSKFDHFQRNFYSKFIFCKSKLNFSQILNDSNCRCYSMINSTNDEIISNDIQQELADENDVFVDTDFVSNFNLKDTFYGQCTDEFIQKLNTIDNLEQVI